MVSQQTQLVDEYLRCLDWANILSRFCCCFKMTDAYIATRTMRSISDASGDNVTPGAYSPHSFSYSDPVIQFFIRHESDLKLAENLQDEEFLKHAQTRGEDSLIELCFDKDSVNSMYE